MELELPKKPRPKTRRSKQAPNVAPVSELVEQVAQLPEVQDELVAHENEEEEASTSQQAEPAAVVEQSARAPPTLVVAEEATEPVRIRPTEPAKAQSPVDEERLQPDNRISSVFQATPITPPTPVAMAPKMAEIREMPLSALSAEQKPVVPERKLSPKPLPPLVTTKPPQPMAIDLYPSLPTPAVLDKASAGGPNFLEALKTAAAQKPAAPAVVQKPAAPIVVQKPSVAAPNVLEALRTVAAQKPAAPLMVQQQQQQLLTEEQLCSFYLNPQLEAVDDFVEGFVKAELQPPDSHHLYQLLSRYLTASKKMEQNTRELAEVDMLTKNAQAKLWEISTHTLTQQGRCGDDKSASGSATYQLGVYRQDLQPELQKTLERDTKLRMDDLTMLENQCKSLSLQTQWTIIEVNKQFMYDHHVALQSPAFLMFTGQTGPSATDAPSRRLLRHCISICFYFIRYPCLPQAFLEDLKRWLVELCSVLLKASTEVDQQFLLCHVLRCPISVEGWGVQLIQPLLPGNESDRRRKIDHFVALLNLLLSPVRSREDFLSRFVQSELDDNSWAILGDDGDDEDENRLVAIPESDLVDILSQFRFETLFADVLTTFGTTKYSSRDVLTLFAFQLTLTKVMFDGMQTYNRPRYRQLCKQVGYVLRQSVKYVAEYWDLVAPMMPATAGDGFGKDRLQREFDRLLLFVVHCIVSSQKLGVWQFLVDLPYKTATEECRRRCQLLIRGNDSPRMSELYSISPEEMKQHFTVKALTDRLHDVDGNDGTYLLSSLAHMATVSDDHAGLDSLLAQLFTVCFVDSTTRDLYWKVGAEAIGVLIEKRPELLGDVLRLIDRNIDQLDQYASEVLTTAPLTRCKLSAADLGSICGKWLVSRSPDHPASRIARRVMSSIDWGPTTNGSLWLDQQVHLVAAEAIVKGHIAQCKAQNSLIAASVKKVAKMASRVPDYEQQFDAFCWDILLRLKLDVLPKENPIVAPSNDLAAFYVHIMQRCLVSPEEFLNSGVPLLSNLIGAGCFAASVAIVARAVFSFAGEFYDILVNTSFLSCVDRLVHGDQTSFAMQLIAGGEEFPGRIVRLMACAIAYQLSSAADGLMGHDNLVATGWTKLLCASRKTDWFIDKPTLFLLDTVARIVFEKDAKRLAGLPDVLQGVHQSMMKAAKDASKGVLGWLGGGEAIPPPLIPTSSFRDAPWLSYFAVMAEDRSFENFHSSLTQSLIKHPKIPLEQAIKKAASKTHAFTIERLSFYRWMDLCSTIDSAHPVFPLACQQLCLQMLVRIGQGSFAQCIGQRFLRAKTAEPKFDHLKNVTLAIAASTTESASKTDHAILYKAISEWLWDSKLYNPQNLTHNVPLDYLLQLVINGDREPWLNYIDMTELREKTVQQRKVFEQVCHLNYNPRPPNRPESLPLGGKSPIQRLLDRLRESRETIQPPTVPIHTGLQLAPLLDPPTLSDARRVLAVFGPAVDCLNIAARSFVSAKDAIQLLDKRYVELMPQLYIAVNSQIAVVLKCNSHICNNPNTVMVTTNTCQYSAATEAQITDNRQRRANELQNLSAKTLAGAALHAAVLEEVARALLDAQAAATTAERRGMIRDSGMCLFYHLINSVSALELLFPATHTVFATCLHTLGSAFVADVATQQPPLVETVLRRQELADLLTPNFTPHCVASPVFLKLYERISTSIRDGLAAQVGLSLLSKIDMNKVEQSFAASEVTALLPITFENVMASGSTRGAFFELCKTHFIRCLLHGFPTNFCHGLRLALKGCESNSTPPEIFDGLIAELGAMMIDYPAPDVKYPVSAVTALEACVVISDTFRQSRQELGERMVSVWRAYFKSICLLCEFLLFRAFQQTFDCELPTSKLEDELNRAFDRVVMVFGPLVEPPGTILPPWTAADSESANIILDHFVSILYRLHSLYDTYLPPGAHNLEALMWSYYASRLTKVTRNGGHVFVDLERQLLRLPWNIFWPSLPDLNGMQLVLLEGAPECASFVTHVFVRVPWTTLSDHSRSQPLDASKAFFSMLFTVLTRCSSKPSNYADCKASMPRMIESLNVCPWEIVPLEGVEQNIAWISANFKPDCLQEETEVLSAFFRLVRRVCLFTVMPQSAPKPQDTSRKQAALVRCLLALMLRGNFAREWAASYYVGLINEAHNVIMCRGDVIADTTCIAHELIAFWATISDEKYGEALVKGLRDWIYDHPDSNLILLLMHVTANAINVNQMLTALKVVETCISAYFLSGRDHLDWSEVDQWVRLPETSRKWLLTVPSSENTVTPQLLTLHAYLLRTLPLCRSVEEEAKNLKDLLRYINGVKPKYAIDEAAYALIVEKIVSLLLRQYEFGTSPTIANEYLADLTKWFLTQTEEKQSLISMIGLSKKQSYSSKFKLVCTLMHLYLTQQTTSEGQKPRLVAEAPVLNSRIQAVKDLKTQKHLAPFSAVIDKALPFFTDVRNYNLTHSVQLLGKVTRSLYIEKYIHLLPQ